jgi:hypothetical protein
MTLLLKIQKKLKNRRKASKSNMTLSESYFFMLHKPVNVVGESSVEDIASVNFFFFVRAKR